MLSIGFLSGAVIYFGMIAFAVGAGAKTGFGFLGAFSLLSFVGTLTIDMTSAEYLRLSTRIFTALMPLIINGAAAASAVMLLKEKDSAALPVVIIAIVLALIMGGILAKRLVDDDL